MNKLKEPMNTIILITIPIIVKIVKAKGETCLDSRKFE
jgi:hypothetical protein